MWAGDSLNHHQRKSVMLKEFGSNVLNMDLHVHNADVAGTMIMFVWLHCVKLVD